MSTPSAIGFDRLLTLTNMPIKRFARDLARQGKSEAYLGLLVNHFNPVTVDALMCRTTLSVAYDGRLNAHKALAVLEDGLALVRAARAAARAAEPIMPAALGPAPGDVEVSAPPPVAATQPQPAAPVTQTIMMLLSALVVFRQGSSARTRSGLRRHRSKAPGASGDRPRDGPGGTRAPRP